MSINLHVNASVNVADAIANRAVFGRAMVIGEHSITGNRQDGPYSSLASVVSAGFTSSAAPEIHGWASRIFAQPRPRTSQVMIGRRAAAEHLATALDAIELVDPAAWYCSNVLLNTPNEILALAAWTESRFKIAIAQSSSAAMLAGTASTALVERFAFGGTATDGTYSIAVRNAWTNALIGTATVVRAAGSPATNSDLATAMRTAWDGVAALAAISSPAAGAGANVDITFDGLGNGYTFTTSAPAPGTLVASEIGTQVQNPGELGSSLAYHRTALAYHDDDSEYLDAAWTSRCLGFDLDAPGGAGTWSYQRFAGITATRLQDAQKSTLMGYPVNFYSPVRFTSGVEDPGVMFPGQMLSGRFIDVTTSLDILQARIEEAILGVLTRAASLGKKIPYTDQGIAQMQGPAMGVLGRLVKAGHFADKAVSSLTGRTTPYIDVPLASEVSTADKAARRLTMSGEAVLAGAINSVGDEATVGLTIDVSF